jgi:hypothetical protein
MKGRSLRLWPVQDDTNPLFPISRQDVVCVHIYLAISVSSEVHGQHFRNTSNFNFKTEKATDSFKNYQSEMYLLKRTFQS